MDLNFGFKEAEFDVYKLIGLGLPLQGKAERSSHRSKDKLIAELKKAVMSILSNKGMEPRLKRAIGALTYALRLQFPTVYYELKRGLPNVELILSLEGVADDIKLQRIAKSKISEYL